MAIYFFQKERLVGFLHGVKRVVIMTYETCHMSCVMSLHTECVWLLRPLCKSGLLL